MSALAALMLVGIAPAAPLSLDRLSLDRLSPAERAAANKQSENDNVARAIDSLAHCFSTSKDLKACGPDTDCGDTNMPTCTYMAYEAWDAYARHYLALLEADPIVRTTAGDAQTQWEKSQAADCALSDAITDRRELPYRSFWSNQCLLDKTSSRALELRDRVIALYGDADVQGGSPYPGKVPVILPK